MSDWINISDPVIQQLKDAGTQIPWPVGPGTAGIACDRATGRLYMNVGGAGIWSSDDHGATFIRIAQNFVSGRCEYCAALNCDPAGNRIAFFVLDGKSGMTLDGGKTWTSFTDFARDWEFGAIDWTDPQARSMMVLHHEVGRETYFSNDTGQSWRFLGRHPEFYAIGVFGPETLVAGTKDGILHSTDAGKNWTPVSDLIPVGRLPVLFEGTNYWLAKQGLVASHDKGATWQVVADTRGVAWGPFFGKDPAEIVVADAKTVYHTNDAGKSWREIATFPTPKRYPPHEQGRSLTLAFDHRARLLYTSCMGDPAYRLEIKD